MINSRDMRKMERLADDLGPRDARLIRRVLKGIDKLLHDNAELTYAADENMAYAADLARQLEKRVTPSHN